MKAKIISTLILLFSFFFFKYVGSFISNSLKRFHEKHNPNLVEKASFFFFGFKAMSLGMAYFCLFLILLIWLNIIPIPS